MYSYYADCKDQNTRQYQNIYSNHNSEPQKFQNHNNNKIKNEKRNRPDEKKAFKIWNLTGKSVSKCNSISTVESSLTITSLGSYKPKHMPRDMDLTEIVTHLSSDGNSSCIKNDLNSTSSFSSSSSPSSSSSSSSSLPGPVISFHNINYVVKTRRRGIKIAYDTRKLLNDVSGMFNPGMNAILGPTGCGKTTLLDILAGRKSHKNMTGHILVDACKQPSNFKCMAGYVVQDDMIMGTLTVRENLMFSANIRLPQSVTKKEKESRVDRVIEELGLTKCAHTKVGTEFIRGVSGGERKRACIGMELIVSPSILFLDEPTTGLDAFTANSVMSLLHKLSRNGLTVVFSIHQPRYSIFKLFDTLMLLGAGRVIYHGQASRALDFFYSQNFQCEEHNNPPDFFLDVINGDVTSSRSGSCCSNNYFTTSYSDSNEGASLYDTAINKPAFTMNVTNEDFDSGVYDPSMDRPSSEKLINMLALKFKKSNSSLQITDDLQKIFKSYKDKASTEKFKSESKLDLQYCTSFLTQLFYVSKRTVMNVFRNPAGSVAQIFMMLFFAFVIGVLYFKMSIDASKDIQNRAGAFFFIVMIQIFGNISAVELFLKERSLFLHESRSGYYRVSVYFVSKMFCDLIPLRLFPLALFCVITYFMMDLQLAVEKFFIYLLNLFLTTLIAAVMTFVISASVRVLAIANILVGLICIIMMLFGGLLLNSESMPQWIRWLEYLSIVRYSYKTLLINELKDMNFNFYKDGQIISNSTTTANEFLKEQGIHYETPWDLWQNMFALAVGTLILAIICYIQLRCLVRNR